MDEYIYIYFFEKVDKPQINYIKKTVQTDYPQHNKDEYILNTGLMILNLKNYKTKKNCNHCILRIKKKFKIYLSMFMLKDPSKKTPASPHQTPQNDKKEIFNSIQSMQFTKQVLPYWYMVFHAHRNLWRGKPSDFVVGSMPIEFFNEKSNQNFKLACKLRLSEDVHKTASKKVQHSF